MCKLESRICKKMILAVFNIFIFHFHITDINYQKRENTKFNGVRQSAIYFGNLIAKAII